MEISHIVDYIMKEAEMKHLEVGIYASSENNPDLKIEINTDEIFPIASVFKLNILVEAARRIAEETLHIEDKIPIRFHHKCPGSFPGKLDEGTEITINNLLQFMIEISDNTCTDMLGEYLGWQKIADSMPLWGITKTRWIMPTKLQMILGCDLFGDLKGKTMKEKDEIWNSLDDKEKMEMILRNYEQIKDISLETLNNAWDEYFNKLSWINQKEIARIFGWKGTAGEYGVLMEKIASGTLISPEISSLAKKYLMTEKRGMTGKCIPPDCIMGRKGGSDEGVRSEVVFIESPKGDRITTAIFVREYTYLPDLTESMEEFITNAGRAIYTYYTSLYQ